VNNNFEESQNNFSINELVFKVSAPYFREVLEKIPKEILRFLNLKESKREYGNCKIKGNSKEIIERLIDFINQKLKENKIVTDIKITKIKRLWNSNELIVNFEYLTLNFDEKLKLELLDSKKEKNYILEIKVKFNRKI